MAIKKEKFFEIIRNVSESEGLNENNLLERIGSKLKDADSGVYSTYNNLKIDKLFMVQDSDKIVNCTLLHLAAECNSVPMVKLLLEKKVKVDEQMSGDVNSKFTALHIAALHGHQEIVQLLLNNDANPLLKDSQGRTLRDIVGDVKGKKAIIEMLEAASSSTRDNENTKASVVERVRVLEKRQKENNNKNNINKVDDALEREQAIRERDAMAQKVKEAEQRLANNQKRIEHNDLHSQHPEQYTTYNGEQTFLNKSNSDDSGIYFDADESEALGQSILENGEDINAQDKDGVTLLHWAVADNNKELAKLLIKHGADVDARNRDKHTPLHYAAVHGYVEIAKYLIDNGANVNAQDQDEHIPLYFAITNDNKELAKLLIKHGADRSLIKDEDLIGRLNSMFVQPSKAKLKELRTQLKGEQKKNESLKQKIQVLESENATLNSELEKTKTKKNEVALEKAQKELTELGSYFTGHEARLEVLEKLNEENESLEQKIQELGNKNTKLKDKLDKTETKTKALLEKTQKELEESKSCIAEYETKLKEFNKENESLRQEIQELGNENATLNSELGKTKTKTNEVSLEKVGKRQFSPKVAYASLAAMLVVGAALSIASELSALLIVAASVVSALIAGGITYTISKPIAPDTELKEVDIQGSAQRCL